ncbi:TIGR02611 family protein [Streptomyces sp. AJS327]|nr:TIGR02611 family protein [Streptomyces sp. AJS327]MBA0050776.1 TIGR02611 family protein [Streptomyces sp. AJS327]
MSTANGESGEGTPKPFVSRAPRYVQASPALHFSWRVGVFVVGLLVVVGGVIMLPLPGPGWLVIFGGMALWATEFAWAHGVLRWTKGKVSEGTAWFRERRERRRAARRREGA